MAASEELKRLRVSGAVESGLAERYIAVGEEKLIAKRELDRERLVRVTNSLIETITSEGFVEKMRVARLQADSGAGMDTAADLLSIASLREAGLDIPDDFRMTSRVFEDREAGLRIEKFDHLNMDPIDIDPLGWGACGGAGGLTFCGCGGFST